MQTRRSTRLSNVKVEPVAATSKRQTKDDGTQQEPHASRKDRAPENKRKEPTKSTEPEISAPRSKRQKLVVKPREASPPKLQVSKQKLAPSKKIRKSSPQSLAEEVTKPEPIVIISTSNGPLRIEEPQYPIVKHLEKFYRSVPENKKNAIDDEIIDQIALEGLSGVTPGKLFQILDAIYPNLNCSKNDNAKKYIWSVIVKRYLKAPLGSNVEVYYIPPGSETNRSDQTQPIDIPVKKAKYPIPKLQFELPVRLPRSTINRYSPNETFLHPVQDGRIMGSCAYYKAREDVTKIVIETFAKHKSDPIKALDELNVKYRLYNLHLVAHQDLRRKALFPNWADPNIDIKLREYCTLELIGKSRTYGTVFPNDAAFGRYRIMLMAKGFITQYQQMSSSPIEQHLKRFSQMFKEHILSTCGASHKGIFKGFSKRVKFNIESMEEIQEHESNYNSEEDDKPIGEVCLDPGRLKVDRDTLKMVYDYIAQSPRGRSQLSIRRKLRLPKFHVRNHIKNLVAVKMIGSKPGNNADKNNAERIYKALYKTKFLRRKVVPVAANSSEKLQGAKTRWDSTDMKAKKILGYRRSAFTQAEDSLLIMCRISSLLICPKSRLSYCVHKRVIRNILHGEFVESIDKTSDACLRRIKYLKRLPNNVMSINELTAELRDDPDIIRLTETRMDTDEQMNRVFKSTLRTVRAKIPHLLGIQNAANMTSIMPVSNIYLPSISTDGNGSSQQAFSSSRFRTSAQTGSVGGSLVVSQISFSNRSNGGSQSIASISMTSRVGGGVGVLGKGCNSTKKGDVDRRVEIKNSHDLNENFELFDCELVVNMNRTPTFERAKNSIDAKFNNCTLATLAFAMAFSLEPSAQFASASERSCKEGSERRRKAFKLLDKFHSNYPDKMVSSVLSKLNKRSLLTRKIRSVIGGGGGGSSSSAPSSSLPVHERSRTALKLNQNVLFLLNRHQSSSLMQLAESIARKLVVDSPGSWSVDRSATAIKEIPGRNTRGSSGARKKRNQTNQQVSASSSADSVDLLVDKTTVSCKLRNRIDLCESNDMASTALLSSMCTLGAWRQLELQLKIPAHVVSLDQGNENFKSLFDRSSDTTKKILTQFISRCGQSVVTSSSSPSSSNQDSTLEPLTRTSPNSATTAATKVEDSRRALFLLRHELRAQALDKCGNLADCLVVQPCNVKFSCLDLSRLVVEAEESNLRQSETCTNFGSCSSATSSPARPPAKRSQRSAKRQQEVKLEQSSLGQPNTKPLDKFLNQAKQIGQVGSSDCPARLWKHLDGSVHIRSLFKLIESILSWIIVMPGIQWSSLQSEFNHLMPEEHLRELLHLMEELDLIASFRQTGSRARPKLFGWSDGPEANESTADSAEVDNSRSSYKNSTTFQTTPIGYIKYCYLLGVYLPSLDADKIEPEERERETYSGDRNKDDDDVEEMDNDDNDDEMVGY